MKRSFRSLEKRGITKSSNTRSSSRLLHVAVCFLTALCLAAIGSAPANAESGRTNDTNQFISVATAKALGRAFVADCDPNQKREGRCGPEGKKATAIREYEGTGGIRWSDVRVDKSGFYELVVKYSNSADAALPANLRARTGTDPTGAEKIWVTFPSQRGKNAGAVGDEKVAVIYLEANTSNAIEITARPESHAPEIIGITVQLSRAQLLQRAIDLGSNTFEFCNVGGYVAALDVEWVVQDDQHSPTGSVGRETTGRLNAGQCKTITAPGGVIHAKTVMRRYSYFHIFDFSFSPVWEGQNGQNNLTTAWNTVEGAGVKAKFWSNGTSCDAWGTSQAQNGRTTIDTQDVGSRNKACSGPWGHSGFLGIDNTSTLHSFLVNVLPKIIGALFGARW